MPKVKLEGVNPRIDGEYELDASYFTSRELHAIKKLTDLRPAEFEEALEKADPDIAIALAMVGLVRAGKITHKQPWASDEVAALWDAAVGKITLALDEEEEEADAGPPPQTPSESESERKPSESTDTSGPDLNGSSEHPERILPDFGGRSSDTSSDSDPVTSAT